MTKDRTAVLLGAGASRDAGLPLTNQLAERIVGQANTVAGEIPPDVLVLNFVYGSMVGYQAGNGGNPLQSVNIERLISAVRLLKERDAHEAAPFVASWKQGASGFGSRTPSFTDLRRLEKAVSEAALPSELGGSATSGARRLAGLISKIANPPASTDAFARLETRLLDGIRQELRPLKSVDYLSPLAEFAKDQGGLDIISLNYDLAVETMAETHGIRVDTGIERWVPGRPIEFPIVSDQINLMKVHGSLNWTAVQGDTKRWLRSPTIEVSDPFANVASPWIVVGDREKLATDGPTLPIFRGAEEALHRATRLVVVGYSFGDDHINMMIRDWMTASDVRTLTVLDPSWSAPSRDTYLYPSRASILEALRAMSIPRKGERQRIRIVRATTADGLSEALSARPFDYVLPITARYVYDDDPFVRLTNHSYDLSNVTLKATEHFPSPQAVKNISLTRGAFDEQLLRVKTIRHGEVLDVFLELDPSHSRANGSIYLTGMSSTGQQNHDLSFEARRDGSLEVPQDKGGTVSSS